MKIFKVLVLFLVCMVASCSSARYSTKEGDYLKHSKTVSPIIVPPGASAPKQTPLYPIPATSVTVGQRPSLKPPVLQ